MLRGILLLVGKIDSIKELQSVGAKAALYT
jgi:hypothetical protein